jgi:hypothetical protein
VLAVLGLWQAVVLFKNRRAIWISVPLALVSAVSLAILWYFVV